MPNGDSQSYNPNWCRRAHERIDEQIKSTEYKVWAVLLLLFGNLAGVVGILITLFAAGC